MRVFNKILVVLFVLAALPAVTLTLVFPDEAIALVTGWLAGLAERVSLLEQPDRQMLLLVALGIDLLLLGLLALQLGRKRAPGARVMRLRGGQGEVTLEAVQQRVQHHVTQVADVVEVRPSVIARGRRVEVALDVVTSPHINVPDKIAEIVSVVREAVGGGLGLKLRGKPSVSIRHTPYTQTTSMPAMSQMSGQVGMASAGRKGLRLRLPWSL